MGKSAVALLAGLLLLSAGEPCAAGELAVTPVRLALSGREPVATVRIRNTGARSTSVQLRVFAWRQAKGEDVLERSDAILANPGTFELAPGAEQLARVGLLDRSAGGHSSYRLMIQELPRREAGRPGEIATLLRISVPLFIEGDHAAPALSWRLERTAEGGPALRVANAGQAHVQLTRLSLAGADGRPLFQEPVSIYVLPGSERRIPLGQSVRPRAGERLMLNADTDGRPVGVFLSAPPDEAETR